MDELKDELDLIEFRKMDSWINGSYQNAGFYSAKSSKLVGLAPEPKIEIKYKDRDPRVPAFFASGWFEYIADEWDIRPISECFKADEQLTNLLYDAMEALIAGDNDTGLPKLR